MSHPSWVCGLKLLLHVEFHVRSRVTPFVGVWIETFEGYSSGMQCMVTPFVGVWIETFEGYPSGMQCMVTPFVGVWIETSIIER